MSLFTQIVILIIVLACMVMVLLAIRQLSNFQGFDDTEETAHLKKEVNEDRHVLTQNNVFSTLVETNREQDIDKKNYNSNSNEPFSPKE